MRKAPEDRNNSHRSCPSIDWLPRFGKHQMYSSRRLPLEEGGQAKAQGFQEGDAELRAGPSLL